MAVCWTGFRIANHISTKDSYRCLESIFMLHIALLWLSALGRTKQLSRQQGNSGSTSYTLLAIESRIRGLATPCTTRSKCPEIKGSSAVEKSPASHCRELPLKGLPAGTPLASIKTSKNLTSLAVDMATVHALKNETLESTATGFDTMHKQNTDKTNAT